MNGPKIRKMTVAKKTGQRLLQGKCDDHKYDGLSTVDQLVRHTPAQ
jgi:hypothetical protein